MTEKIILIPGRIKSAVVGGNVTGAADIIDDVKGKTQDTINQDVDTAIGDDNTPGTIKGRIKNLENSVGPGGSVEEQINAKISTLDATVTKSASADGLSLSVTEIDGKLTAVSGAIAPNTYDSYGSAATTKAELLGDAASNYNTLGKLEDAIQSEASTRSSEIGTDSTAGTVKGRIKSLETLVGDTSVDTQIDNKIGALDSTQSQEAGTDGLALSVTEADGKITSISGSIAANTYDSYGSAATAKSDVIGDAASDYNTLGKLEDAVQAEAVTRGNADAALDGRLTTVEEKIPSQATSENQLADKAFVNSSISTATADFKGTYNTLEELQAVTADNNDYGFVRTVDTVGNVVYNRYKYNGTQWVFEYALNNSSFTEAQWAAINSNLTSAHQVKLDALPANDVLQAALDSKQPNIADLETIRSGAALGATAYQKPSSGVPETDLTEAVQNKLNLGNSAYQKPGTGIPSSDMTSEVQVSLGKADTAYQKPSNGIPESDLDTTTQEKIDAGSTAYQKPDTGIPLNDLADDVQQKVDLGGSSYQKPTTGIPESDLDAATQNKIDLGGTSYQKPQSGIPSTDMTDEVQLSLSKADTALQSDDLNNYYDKDETDTLLSGKQDTLTIDTTPTEDSGNPISSGAVYTLQQNTQQALDGKQATLTFDDVPTAGSNNPVKSSGILSTILANSGIQFVEVQTLPVPSNNTLGKVYLLNTGSGYEWYVTVFDDTVTPIVYSWRNVNTSSVDLSDYYTKRETNTLLDAKQDVLVYATVEQAKTAANELT